MQLLPHQNPLSALRDLVCEALELLTSGQLELLVGRFGYAMAFERNPVCAPRAPLLTLTSPAKADGDEDEDYFYIPADMAFYV